MATSDPDRMTRGARHAFALLAVLMLVTGAASIAYSSLTAAGQNATIAQLRSQQQASCAFARDLGSVPIADKPKPSKLGVSLVADSRAQWRALHCPGTLPPAPGLAHWAAVYHLPAS